jgi:hypothetical protein
MPAPMPLAAPVMRMQRAVMAVSRVWWEDG